MNKRPSPYQRANCASIDLPSGEVPDWVHLLPAAMGEVRTHDGRGPYRVVDPAAIVSTSLQADPRDAGGLIVDENHSSDLAAPQGGQSPARGHIVQMEVRADGIWGKVNWTAAGRALMSDRAYRGISPVIAYDDTGKVHAILRAGLVNYPNLRGLTALNSEIQMDLTKLAIALGLPETATMEDCMSAVAATKQAGATNGVALQASLQQIGSLVGVTGGDTAAILAGVTLAVSGKDAFVALNAEVTGLRAQLTALTERQARAASETYIDAQIALKRVGLNAENRTDMIALHMSQPAMCAKLLEVMPCAGVSHTAGAAPNTAGTSMALNAEQRAVADQMGISHDTYLATLKKEAA